MTPPWNDLIAWAQAQGACVRGLAWARSHDSYESACADPDGAKWRRWALGHSACPADIVADRAVHDPDWLARAVALRHPGSPAAIVADRAVNDPDPDVRAAALDRLGGGR